MKRLFLAGNSCGGHISMMAALFNAHELCTPFRRPNGIFIECASTDLLECAKAPLAPWMKIRPSAGLLGVDRIEGNEELARKASCSSYINEKADIPPVLILHGDADPVVSVENSRILYRKLVES
jgi:acetyl esterase/lipase